MKITENKALVAGIIICVIAVGVIGWYVLNDDTSTETQPQTTQSDQATEETAIPDDWDRYTNDEYGLEFSHPANITIETYVSTGEDVNENAYSEDATELFVICFKTPGLVQNCAGKLTVSDQPLASSVEQLEAYYAENNIPTNSKPFTTNSGQPGITVFVSDPYGGYTLNFVEANDKTYAFPEVRDGAGDDLLSAEISSRIFDSTTVR